MSPGHHHEHAPPPPHPVAALIRRLSGWLRPHSHDLADHIDPPAERSAHGIRVTQATLAVLSATAGVQLVIAVSSGSVALLADMLHNLADALTSIPLWIAFALGRRPASRAYGHGYGRAEDLAGVFIVLVIAASAVLVGWQAIDRLLHPEPLTHVGWVLAAGVVGVAGNEVAAVVRIRVGRRIGSAALVADGLHARTDTMASLAVVVAAVCAWLGLTVVDPIVGLVITALMGWVMLHTARQVFRRLLDGVEPSIASTIHDVPREVAGVERVDWARARWVGHRLHGELAITVDQDLNVAEAHTIAEQVSDALTHALPHLENTTVHVNPCGHDGSDPHAGRRGAGRRGGAG